jgi:uncharacterized membrane protein YozB (DUF420 family)
VLDGPQVILVLKVAVGAVTALLLASLAALARGNVRLHGRINLVFATLTLTAVLGLELLVRVLNPDIFNYFTPEDMQALRVHLSFSVPCALLLPVMLYTGLRHHRNVHVVLALVFSVLWAGTFVTGIFFLPHAGP